jgi:Fic family protein
MHLLGQVQAYRRLLPSVEVLIYGSLRREAIASSTIEGTVASADELVLYELQGTAPRSAVREVANYAAALQRGQELIRSRPISLNLILELHSVLLTGVRGQGAAVQCGEFFGHLHGCASPLDCASNWSGLMYPRLECMRSGL